jgi:peroxiredoxin
MKSVRIASFLGLAIAMVTGGAALGCDRASKLEAQAVKPIAEGPSVGSPSVAALSSGTPSVGAAAQAAAPVGNESAPARAEVGKPAPDFTLRDLSGAEVKLSSFRGKTVVLEWFNPLCPFVKAAHTKGSLVDAAKRATGKGVVWLAINSGAPGKQGHGEGANREGAKTYGLTHPILLDETGAVGKMYGATNTPHMFVVDGAGTLVYAGAVDNSPDGEGESPQGGKLVRYVDEALSDLAAGKPVRTSTTKAYGCSVKYGS